MQQPIDLDLFPWLHIVGDIDEYAPSCCVRYRYLGQRIPNVVPQDAPDTMRFGNK